MVLGEYFLLYLKVPISLHAGALSLKSPERSHNKIGPEVVGAQHPL